MPFSLSRFALVVLFLAPACEDNQRVAPPDHRAPARSESPRAGSPVAIGYGDAEVPQFHPPLRLTPPRVNTSPAPLESPVALAALPEGGAIVAWANSHAGTHGPTSSVSMRLVSRDGRFGPVFAVRTMRGTVRGISMAARANDALMVWNAEFGGAASQLTAQRVQHDGTQVGGIFGIGTFRIAPDGYDAGPGGDQLGFFVRVAPSLAGYAVALRGPLVTCRGQSCNPVRVVEIDEFNDLLGRGGVDDPHPARPVALLARAGQPWSVMLNLATETAQSGVTTFGQGALSAIGPRSGVRLEAAWLEVDAARALVTSAPRGRSGTREVLEAASGDAGAGAGWPVASARVICRGGVAMVQLRGARGERTVAADVPGGDALLAWALENGEPHSAAREAAAWIGGGVLAVRDGVAEFARCEGDALGAASPIPWEAPAATP